MAMKTISLVQSKNQYIQNNISNYMSKYEELPEVVIIYNHIWQYHKYDIISNFYSTYGVIPTISSGDKMTISKLFQILHPECLILDITNIDFR